MTKSYPTITPYLLTTHATEIIAFLKKIFDAKEIDFQKDNDGAVRHATLQIKESMVMLSEGNKDYPPMPSMLYVYMDDCDAYYQKAIEAGGVSLREPRNEDYGHRSSGVKDIGGNQWWIAGPLKHS